VEDKDSKPPDIALLARTQSIESNRKLIARKKRKLGSTEQEFNFGRLQLNFTGFSNGNDSEGRKWKKINPSFLFQKIMIRKRNHSYSEIVLFQTIIQENYCTSFLTRS
jgi:hypothetical protein